MHRLTYRIFVLILIFVLCLSVLPATVSAAPQTHPNTHVNTGDQRADIIAVALTQVGYYEGQTMIQSMANGMDTTTLAGVELLWLGVPIRQVFLPLCLPVPVLPMQLHLV